MVVMVLLLLLLMMLMILMMMLRRLGSVATSVVFVLAVMAMVVGIVALTIAMMRRHGVVITTMLILVVVVMVPDWRGARGDWLQIGWKVPRPGLVTLVNLSASRAILPVLRLTLVAVNCSSWSRRVPRVERLWSFLGDRLRPDKVHAAF